jgi:pyruvate formate-lyase activating enzyme-like uncharacterized protein
LGNCDKSRDTNEEHFYKHDLFLADDQIFLQKSEHYLEAAVYKAAQTAKDYNVKICTNRTKTMAFSGKLRIRTRTVKHERKVPFEQESHFIT